MTVFGWVLLGAILYVCIGALTALWASDAEPVPGVPSSILGAFWPSVLIGFAISVLWVAMKGDGS